MYPIKSNLIHLELLSFACERPVNESCYFLSDSRAHPAAGSLCVFQHEPNDDWLFGCCPCRNWPYILSPLYLLSSADNVIDHMNGDWRKNTYCYIDYSLLSTPLCSTYLARGFASCRDVGYRDRRIRISGGDYLELRSIMSLCVCVAPTPTALKVADATWHHGLWRPRLEWQLRSLPCSLILQTAVLIVAY